MGYESIAHEAEGRMGYWQIARLNIFCKLKLDINPFLPPKHNKYGGCFSLLVGYNIEPTSSSTNQNAALMIDH